MAGLNIRSVREAQAHIDVRTARLWQDHLHYFDVPIDELVRRLEKRNSERNPNAFPISRSEIEEYFRIFEPPDEGELALFPASIVHGLAAMTGQRFVVPD